MLVGRQLGTSTGMERNMAGCKQALRRVCGRVQAAGVGAGMVGRTTGTGRQGVGELVTGFWLLTACCCIPCHSKAGRTHLR